MRHPDPNRPEFEPYGFEIDKWFPTPYGGLHRRQQQSNQDADDRDDHQQLDQGERLLTPRASIAKCLG